MLWAHTCQAAVASVIPLWTITGTPPLAAILPLAFAIGSARVFADAGTFGAVAAIVGVERFTEGQATLSAAWGVGLFAGPALGGLLVVEAEEVLGPEQEPGPFPRAQSSHFPFGRSLGVAQMLPPLLGLLRFGLTRLVVVRIIEVRLCLSSKITYGQCCAIMTNPSMCTTHNVNNLVVLLVIRERRPEARESAQN